MARVLYSRYDTQGMDAAMLIYQETSGKFSWTGKYGAGSGFSYDDMTREVKNVKRAHPRMTWRSGYDFLSNRAPNPIQGEKMATAKQIAARKLFAERARAGTLKKGTRKRKANPTKKSPIPRTGITKAEKIARPSQITRKKPTPRLTARRKVAAKPGAPSGYFPNPQKGYRVEILRAGKTAWKRVATFESAVTAKEYANAVARVNKTIAVRVMAP